MKKENLTRKDIKRIIRTGNKLKIAGALYEYWKLDRKTGWLPYKDN